ncbi:MAG: dihydrodipicolinate synthase family protein [Alphaproteobacteria bacterium]|nr:dihydrodipicolinate synthase family protein [Alphaproteobacteria bacterium]
MMKNALFGGVNAAILTPQKDDLSPNIPMLVRHAQWLLANGCDGLGLLGTTGEANSFSLSERTAIIEGVVAAGVPAAKLMPGTGACAITDAVDLTRKAAEAGCRGVLMLPPFYYKGVSDDGLFAFFSEVVQRLGTDKTKIYLYHFPQQSAVPFSLALIERLLKAYPTVIKGVKDSSAQWANMKAMIDAFARDGFEVYSGSDEFVLDILKSGGAGCITAASNINSSVGAKVVQTWTTPEAEGWQKILTATRKATTIFPPISCLKAIMAHHTGTPSWTNLRPPHTRLSAEQTQKLLAALGETGLTLPKAA